MDEKISAKKMISRLIIFMVVAVLVTTSLIFIKNSSNNADIKNENKVDNDVKSGDKVNNESSDKVLGTKRTQKYNQNDLEFIRTQVQRNDGEHTISIRISGLKNKEIENKINEDIAREEKNVGTVISEGVSANFSNVLSLCIDGSECDNYLNYDLTTGNRLEIEDLFVPGASIDLYVKNAVSIYLQKEELEGELIEYDQKYDELKYLEWVEKYNSSPKKFNFYYAGVTIWYGEGYKDSVTIDFKDHLENVVIFTKYVTQESIFERDDIGTKNLYVCKAEYIPNLYGDVYYDIRYVTSNFRINARIACTTESADIMMNQQVFVDYVEKLKQKINARKDEVQKIAQNSDKYYYLIMNDFIDIAVYSDVFSVYDREELYEVDKKDFDEWFDDRIVDREERDHGYGYYVGMDLSEAEEKACNLDRKSSYTLHVKNSDKVCEGLEGLFKDKTDYYISVIKDDLKAKFKLSEDEVNDVIEKWTYEIHSYGIDFIDTYKGGCVSCDMDLTGFLDEWLNSETE